MRMALYRFAQYVRGEYTLDRGHDKSDDFGFWNLQIGQGEQFLIKKKNVSIYEVRDFGWKCRHFNDNNILLIGS